MDLPIRSRTFDDAVDMDSDLDQLVQSTEDDLDEQYDIQDAENRQTRHMWDLIMGEIKIMCQKSATAKEWEQLVLKMRDDESYKAALQGTCNGAGFLHYFVNDIQVARSCPREVATVIIAHNPDSVEQVIDEDQHPLTIAIRASCDSLFLSMLTSLSQRGITLLKDYKGEGRQCIKAAFDALRQRCHFSMTIAAYKLVGWASDSMLSGLKTDNELTPLQVAVTADQSYINGNVQLKLVKLLLKCHEPSIHEKVLRGTYKTLWGRIFLQEDISVYEWHQRTLDLFRKDQNTSQHLSSVNSDRNRQGNANSQKQGQKMNSGSTSGMTTANTNRGQTGQNKPPDSPASNPPMTMVSNIEKKEMPRNNASSLAKQPGSGQTSNKKPTISGQLAIRAKPNKRSFHQAKDNPNVEETSKRIKIELQEHYLRSIILTPPGEDNAAVSDKDETEIKEFFGNDMQDVEIGLDLGNQPHGEPLTEASIRRFFKDTTFNSVLAYVSLPPAPLKLIQSNKKFQAPRFSDDRLFYFDWLHNEKKVDKILKLIVNDTKQPHRDEVIEEAVGGKSSSKDGLKHDFKVEILKWRKVDLDPTTIAAAAPNVRELHLDWSGNNVALLGWSAKDGLPALKHLRQIHLMYSTDGESGQRISRNIELFKSQLNSCRQDQNKQARNHEEANYNETTQGRQEYSTIEVIEHRRTRGGGAEASPSMSTGQRQEPKHKWINSMRKFVACVPELPEDMEELSLSSKLTSRRVTVALIDDGVDVFTSELARFSDRFFPGVSFDRSNDRHSSREWSSRGGHGTLMAKLILAVCPHADIVTYRVLMRPDHETNMLIPDAESAAKAIKHAVKRGVDIISMSWTISKPAQGIDNSGYDRLKNVMAEAANESGSGPVPLLFCAAADDGPGGSSNDDELPSAMAYSKLICIGAATSTGQTWPQVSNANRRQYFFPGVDVPDLRQNFQYNHESLDTDPFVNSGSSIACALAVGQAALILHCVKLGVYYTKKKDQMREMRQVEIITEDDLERMKEYEYMQKAFSALCSENLSKHKVSFPTQGFEKATDQMQKLEDQGMLNSLEGFEPIVKLVRGLIGQRPN